MGKAILMLGVPGVGKSTLARSATASISNIMAVDFADLMLQSAKSEIHRDELQFLTLDERRVLFENANKQLSKIVKNYQGLILVEAHFALRINDNIICMGNGLLRVVTPVGVILIEAPADIIVQRRINDSSRRRQVETAEAVKELQSANYLRMLEVTVLLQVDPALVINMDLEKAKLSMNKLVREFRSSYIS
jgi:adenylate kinase